MSRRRLDSRSGLTTAGLLADTQTPISTEPLESFYELTGELGRCDSQCFSLILLFMN